MKQEFIDIVVTMTGNEMLREQLMHGDDLSQLGLNSIQFIALVVELEKKFDIRFENEYLDHSKISSIDALCNYITERIGQKA